MIKEFSKFFENFKLRKNVDTRLIVFENDIYRFRSSLKIRVLISDAGLAEVFKKSILNLPLSIRNNIKILLLSEKKNKKYGLINVSPASVFGSPDYNGSTLTQAILGERVDVLQEKGEWLRVKCEDGYIGWVNCSQVELYDDNDISAWQEDWFYTYRELIGDIKESPKDYSASLRKITVGSKLPYLKRKGQWIKVRLPDNSEGWIKNKNEFRWLDNEKKSIREKIVLTSKKFLGIPYLWGGKTPLGFDCSGFVQNVFYLNGISLPRDSDLQYRFTGGNPENMRKGDLLFFGKNRVSHVGIYIGRKRFIHSKGFVRINSFDSNDKYYDKYLKEILIKNNC